MRPLRASPRSTPHSRNIKWTARPVLQRQFEEYTLAFLLLGGRKATRDFLDAFNRDLRGLSRERAGKSVLGLVEVVRVLRRQALHIAQSAARS